MRIFSHIINSDKYSILDHKTTVPSSRTQETTCSSIHSSHSSMYWSKTTLAHTHTERQIKIIQLVMVTQQ